MLNLIIILCAVALYIKFRKEGNRRYATYSLLAGAAIVFFGLTKLVLFATVLYIFILKLKNKNKD